MRQGSYQVATHCSIMATCKRWQESVMPCLPALQFNHVIIQALRNSTCFPLPHFKRKLNNPVALTEQ